MKKIRKWTKCLFMVSIIFFIILPTLSYPQTEREKKTPEGSPKAESPDFFVNENMEKFKSKLEKLEANYKECCGSLLNVYTSVDQNKILENLPKPKTLSVHVTYPAPPWKKTKAVSENRILVDSFDYKMTKFYAPMPFHLDNLAYYRLVSDNLKAGDADIPVAAADKETSIILGLSQEVGLSPGGYFLEEVGPVTLDYCCIDPNFARTGKCGRFASVIDYQFPRDPLPSQMKLRLDIKGGGEILGEGLGIRFTEPGDKEVSFESPMKGWTNKYYCSTIMCVYGWEVIDRCEPNGVVRLDRNLKINAIRLKGFGIRGLDVEGKTPQLDYFIHAERGWNFNKTQSIGESVVLVDYGKGEAITRHYADLITTSTTSYGPVIIGDGIYKSLLYYFGGIGSTKFKTRLSYKENKEHEITVNAVEMVYDHNIRQDNISQQGIVHAGRKYKITLLVKGPANMKNYNVTWEGKRIDPSKDVELSLTWEKERTDFTKVGELWSSTNTFQINYKNYDPKKIKDNFRFEIHGKIVRNSDNMTVYEDWKEVYVSYPGIEEIKLYTSIGGIGGIGDKKYSEPPVSIDIFTAPLTANFNTRDVYLYPHVVLADKSIYPINEITDALVELKQSNPGVVRVSQVGQRVIGITGGKTDIQARVGMDLQKNIGIVKGDEVQSKPLRFYVNVIQPVTVDMEGNKRIYRLTVESYSLFEGKYMVVWSGKGFSTTTPFMDEGLYSNATLTTYSEITDIKIVDAKSEVVAEMRLDEKSNVGRIRLLPPDIPVTTIGKEDLMDYGSLESITKCVEKIRDKMRLSGFEPGKTPEAYCQEKREQDKKEIAQIRASQKEMNKLAKELEKQGKELIVLADKATVGAVIEVPAKFDKTGLFCYWRLIDAHAQLMFQDDISPIQWIDEKKGGCLGVITGIQKYITPEAKVQVELRMDTRTKGKVEVVSPAETFTFIKKQQ